MPSSPYKRAALVGQGYYSCLSASFAALLPFQYHCSTVLCSWPGQWNACPFLTSMCPSPHHHFLSLALCDTMPSQHKTPSGTRRYTCIHICAWQQLRSTTCCLCLPGQLLTHYLQWRTNSAAGCAILAAFSDYDLLVQTSLHKLFSSWPMLLFILYTPFAACTRSENCTLPLKLHTTATIQGTVQ